MISTHANCPVPTVTIIYKRDERCEVVSTQKAQKLFSNDNSDYWDWSDWSVASVGIIVIVGIADRTDHLRLSI